MTKVMMVRLQYLGLSSNIQLLCVLYDIECLFKYHLGVLGLEICP